MKPSATTLGKRTLKYGGKSGILPEVRPIFRHHPIKPKSEQEKAEEARIEQGFAEGVPLPRKKGFKFQRRPAEVPVVTVEERLAKIAERMTPLKPESEMTNEERWEAQKNEVRRQHLHDAYVAEAQRLEHLEAMEARKKEAESKKAKQPTHTESEESMHTLPTIDLYLSGPIMRPRTAEEQAIVEERRLLNRKTRELEAMEAKANKILELYHAAGSFITTEKELEEQINVAFGSKIGLFETKQMRVMSAVMGAQIPHDVAEVNESLLRDAAYGELKGHSGLEQVKDVLSGAAEVERREATRKAH